MDNMLEGIQSVRVIMDDILIVAPTQIKHDKILEQVIRRGTQWNLKFNYKKCQLCKDWVKYVGHVITSHGLEADPDKVAAVREMPTPRSKEDVRRFLGFVQYIGKFIPNLSEISEPLRELTKKEIQFHWEDRHEKSFKELKEKCIKMPVLALLMLQNLLQYSVMHQVMP